MTNVKSGLRIVLAPMYEGDWLNGIAGDVAAAARNMNAELFLMGDKRYIDSVYYVALEDISETLDVSRLTCPLVYPGVDLSRLKALESLNVLANFPSKPVDRGRIDTMLNNWFAEIVLALKLLRPDFGLVWNGSIHKAAVYVEAFRYLGIPFVFAEKGFLPGSWCMDRMGINANSSIVNQDYPVDVDPAPLRKKINDIDNKGESAWEQPGRLGKGELMRKLGIPGNKRIVFFPGQVDSDTNIILFSPHFKDTSAALSWLSELPSEQYFIVVKPHPKGNLTKRECENILKGRGMVVSDVNVLDLIAIADCIVTINSTVAFESSIRGKPVLMLGQGVLTGKRFVKAYVPDKLAAEQLDGAIDQYSRNKEDNLQESLAFLSFLDRSYYTYMGNVDRTQQLLSEYVKDVEPGRQVFNSVELALFQDRAVSKRLEKYVTKKSLAGLLSRKVKGVLERHAGIPKNH